MAAPISGSGPAILGWSKCDQFSLNSIDQADIYAAVRLIPVSASITATANGPTGPTLQLCVSFPIGTDMTTAPIASVLEVLQSAYPELQMECDGDSKFKNADMELSLLDRFWPMMTPAESIEELRNLFIPYDLPSSTQSEAEAPTDETGRYATEVETSEADAQGNELKKGDDTSPPLTEMEQREEVILESINRSLEKAIGSSLRFLEAMSRTVGGEGDIEFHNWSAGYPITSLFPYGAAAPGSVNQRGRVARKRRQL